jgi:hypothetical protein
MLLKNAKKKSNDKIINSGYSRVLYSSIHKEESLELSEMITNIHATSISNGSELERIICDIHKGSITKSVLIENVNFNDENTLINTLIIKNFFKKNINIDFCYITKDVVYLIELKDRHEIDTEKSTSIIDKCENLNKFFINHLSETNINKKVETKVILFNSSKEDIINNNFKGVINAKSFLQNGEYLCSILDINITDIFNIRKGDRDANFEYFITKYTEILEKLHINNKDNKNIFIDNIIEKIKLFIN